jgi:hypothetical protein
MIEGKIVKKPQGIWVIRYNEKVVKNCVGCRPFTTFNELPIDNQTLGYDEGLTAYFTEQEMDGGKFAVLGSPLDYLAEQAQELDMGYTDGWHHIFKEIEDSLNSPLPIRVKNWLRNKYYSPVIK